MRILVDSPMMYGDKSGIGYHLTHLLQALARIDQENQYTLLYVTDEAVLAKVVRTPEPNFAATMILSMKRAAPRCRLRRAPF